MTKKKNNNRVKTRQRTQWIFGVFLLFFFGLVGRLIYLMVFEAPELKAMAVEQRTNEVTIEAKRGKILDRNGIELAISANLYRVDLDLYTIRRDILKKNKEEDLPTKLSEVSRKLADATGMEYDKVYEIVTKTNKDGIAPGSVKLIRKIEKESADKVSALKINGVMISSDTKRYYPNNNFASHIIGFTKDDVEGDKGIDGVYGVEAVYNDILKGTAGKRISEMDQRLANELPFATSTYSKPVEGKDVVLTIDATVQQFVEQAADKALKDNKAKAISIIVSDPTNGEIIAMVNKPDYDPNNPYVENKTTDELYSLWRNRAVMDSFEPGSILKVITAAAALEEHVTKDSDYFECKGYLTVGPHKIKCDEVNGHGTLSLSGIIENSCNVGFMILGDRLGKEKLNYYINTFGFGQKTGIDLDGEALGIVKKTENIDNVDLATLSFGQVDTITCIQYIAAFNAVANGGYLIKPHVMKEISHVDENKTIVDKTYENTEKKQIISAETSKALRGYLENVVTDGTGVGTYIEGYKVAGKTGTAQKPINGVYAPGKYVSSFAGMAPADNPKYTVIVSVDEPDSQKYFAAETAVPVAKEVFLELFNNLALSSNGSYQGVLKEIFLPELRGLNRDEAMKRLKALHITYDIDNNGNVISTMDPAAGTMVKEGTKIKLTTDNKAVEIKTVIMPNLKGYSKEKANEALNSLSLKASFNGDGIVVGQSIAAGQKVNKGTTVSFSMKKSND